MCFMEPEVSLQHSQETKSLPWTMGSWIMISCRLVGLVTLWKTPAYIFRVEVSQPGMWVSGNSENYHQPVPARALKEDMYIHIRHN